MAEPQKTQDNTQFPQRRVTIGSMQIVTATDELFNHVDEGLPMWSGDGDRTVEVNVEFVHAFKAPPSITLGITGIDSSHDQNLRFWLAPIEIKPVGFKIYFSTWSDTHIARAAVSW